MEGIRLVTSEWTPQGSRGTFVYICRRLPIHFQSFLTPKAPEPYFASISISLSLFPPLFFDLVSRLSLSLSNGDRHRPDLNHFHSLPLRFNGGRMSVSVEEPNQSLPFLIFLDRDLFQSQWLPRLLCLLLHTLSRKSKVRIPNAVWIDWMVSGSDSGLCTDCKDQPLVKYTGKLEDGTIFERKGTDEEPLEFMCFVGTTTMPRNSLYSSIGGRGAASGNIDQRAKGRLDGMQSFGMATMSDETREALPKALLELFHVHKVCRYVYLLAALEEAGFLIGLEWNRLSESKDWEVKVAFLQLPTSSGCREFFGEVEKTLKEVGRMKYLRPLYTALVQGLGKEEAKILAKRIFAEACDGYHPIAQGVVESILSKNL